MPDALWELASVTLAGSHQPRLAGLTLTIHPGVTAVIGYSGAGKTSLLNLLAGFESQDQGEIHRSLPGSLDGPPLFWVPQNDGLWPHLSVRDHLRAVTPATQVDPWLTQFDLAARADARPAQLSQGERSRLSVARALASSAAVIVMDEPLVHVDPARADRYWAALRAGVKRLGASLVFATHDPRRVLAEASRVVCLKAGQLLYEGPVEPLYNNPASAELAECLGEFNWLAPDEGRLWLGEREAGPCLRPERIAVRKDETAKSPIVVRQSDFRGSVAGVEVWHEVANTTRTFLHRPPANHLAPGDRVWIKLCLLFLAALFLTACGGGAEPSAPKLVVKSTHVWQMPPDDIKLPAPRAVALGPDNSWLVIDTAGRVINYGHDGQIIRQWRMPDASVGRPEHLVMLKDGRILVPDTHYFRLVFFDKEGNVVQTLGKAGDGPQGFVMGKGPGEFIYPVAAAQDEEENIYVCEYGSNDRIQKFTRDGKFILQFGSFGTGPGQFQRPMGIVCRQGKVYIADAVNGRIEVFDYSGKFLSIFGTPEAPLQLNLPYDLSLEPGGTLLLVEYGAGCVTRLTLDGKLLGRFGSIGPGENQFLTPWGLSVDSNGRALVADTGNRRLVELKF